jgi:hypothetical protein
VSEHLACLVSAAAYAPSVYQSRLASHGLLELREIDKPATDTQVVLCEFPGLLIVGFRGTQPDCLTDLLTVFDTFLTPATTGRIHNGFQIAWRSVRLEVLQEISNAIHDGCRVILTGHSMGGALAGCALLDLQESPELSAITFGAPRFCDRTAAAKLTALKRVVLALDLIPRVPPPVPEGLQFAVDLIKRFTKYGRFPSLLPPGYAHGGVLERYSEGQPFRGNWLGLTLERLRGYWQHFGRWGLAGLEGHKVTQYLQIYETKNPG